MVAEVVFGDHALPLLDQIAEHFKHFARESNSTASSVERITSRIQGTLRKMVLHTSSPVRQQYCRAMGRKTPWSPPYRRSSQRKNSYIGNASPAAAHVSVGLT